MQSHDDGPLKQRQLKLPVNLCQLFEKSQKQVFSLKTSIERFTPWQSKRDPRQSKGDLRQMKRRRKEEMSPMQGWGVNQQQYLR